MKKEWFETWFDTAYYHALYGDHNEEEAKQLGSVLLDFLRLPPSSRLLDLACGKGRFSKYLASRGYEVVGADLSEESILQNISSETEELTFFVHDMRKSLRINYFDAVFNIFTSFGYFDSERDNLKTLQAVWQNLKPNGLFVLDYFNSSYVTKDIISECHKKVGKIDFFISKKVVKGFVEKEIEVRDAGKVFHFKERVQLFSTSDFDNLLGQANLKILYRFGDYQLSPFDEQHSPRQLIIAQKI